MAGLPPILPGTEPTFLHSDAPLARLARPVARFLSVEAAGGLVLVVAAVAALAWANSPWQASYTSFWATPLEVHIGPFVFEENLGHWVNDALMAIFFFVVGLEIKREVVTGELRDRRAIALPALAALGGMMVPAALYLAVNVAGPGADGWGIPMATDIAFALGVVALLGSRIPSSLKVFLLTLAIIDDIGAITVIAVFYTDDLAPQYLLGAAGLVGFVMVLRRSRVVYPPVYVSIGIALWLAVYESGVHATIAGVAMGLLTPAKPLQSELDAQTIVDHLENRPELTVDEVRATARAITQSVSLCDRLIELLHPWTSYVIVPIFALANAGITLTGGAFSSPSAVLVGVMMGLVVGKPLGITAFVWLSVRLGLATLPEGVTWRQLTGLATLAGIGFTVSLFIAGLAFTDAQLQTDAKTGILVASVIAAVLGSAVLVRGRVDADSPASERSREPSPAS
jgi:NhaA family Na+:H+ antiporter